MLFQNAINRSYFAICYYGKIAKTACYSELLLINAILLFKATCYSQVLLIKLMLLCYSNCY